MASCVEAGPGSKLVAETPSSKFLRAQPSTVIDAKCAQKRDVRRGTPEPDDPDAAPLARDCRERDTLFDGIGHCRRYVPLTEP